MTTAAGRLRAAASAIARERQARLGAAAARTDALSPLAVLGRGYALCQQDDGTLLREAAQTAPGEAIRVRLARGRLRCEVTATEASVEER